MINEKFAEFQSSGASKDGFDSGFGVLDIFKTGGEQKQVQMMGNYYYGARYYNPTWSVWLSVDPKAHWYPSMSSYNFTANNPVILVDPNGQWVEGEGFFTNLFYSDDRALEIKAQ